jgi:hypothetical protein
MTSVSRPRAGALAGPWALSVVVPLVLAAVSLRSLFQDGYLLQVDAVFGPRAAPVGRGFGAPVGLLQAAGVELLGGAWSGRLWAFGTLFLAGFAPMVLLRRSRWFAQMAAGLLGVLNPWVYDRFVEGQWGVLNAAAGLFLWIAAWEKLAEQPGPLPAALLAVCTAAVAAFDPHALGPLAVLALAAALSIRIWRRRGVLVWSAGSLGFLVVLLAYPVISFFVDDERGGYATVRQFTRDDFVLFRSVRSDDYGLIPNLIGLYGYWGERLGRFPLANADADWWPLTTAVIVAAAVVGAWLRRDRAWLLACGVVGLVVSASTALPGGVDAAAGLARRLPLVAAYREPQKWNALWLVALVVLAACASDALARRPRRAWAGPAVAYAVVVCALFPAGIAQIRSVPSIVEPVEYPSYWYRTADYLARGVPEDEPVLVLPWHLYQPLGVSEGRLVANPARVFFPGRLIVPQNLEIPGRFSEVSTRYDRIGAVIRRRGYRSCAVARAIRSERVNWVLVFDGVEGRGAVAGLRRCGFTLVQGGPGRTVVLRS